MAAVHSVAENLTDPSKFQKSKMYNEKSAAEVLGRPP
jgi:hypothetical protein